MTSKNAIHTAIALLIAAALPLAAQEAAKPAPAPAPAADGTYKVATHRPYTKGQKYTLTLQASIHEESFMGLSPDAMDGGSGDMEMSVVAKVTVMDVNTVGEATAMMAHIDKAQFGPKGKVKAMAVEGADLGMALSKGSFRVTARDGRKISEEEQSVLSQAFEPPTGISSDEYLSPGKDVKPGESWGIKKEVWAKVLAAQKGEGAKVPDPSKLDGKVTFVGVEDWTGTPCLHLKISQADNSADSKDFTGEYSMQVTQDAWIPVDIKLNKNKAEGEQSVRVKGKIHKTDGTLLNVRSVTKVDFKAMVE
jgi:hypothetical protein